MIVKLDKNEATTEGTRGLFHFDEDKFISWPSQRKKVKFITNYKTLNFLGKLELKILANWDALYWYKKQ